MNLSEGNSGVQISNSSVSAQNVIGGSHARVEAVGNWGPAAQTVEQLRAQLRALVAELDRQPVDDKIKASASDAVDELDQPEPRGPVFIAFLETVAAGVGAVTGLVGKIEPLIRAARAIL